MMHMIQTTKILIETRGDCQIVDITPQVRQTLADHTIAGDATIVLFHVGSTGGLTTLEYEPGLVHHDIKAMFDKIAPPDGLYEHEKTWDDDNGHAHCSASLLGPSLTIPVLAGQLALGTWQQIVLIDFDTRPRRRTIVCQILT
jgi:secondary thiamine-phosphate synthase enzyme